MGEAAWTPNIGFDENVSVGSVAGRGPPKLIPTVFEDAFCFFLSPPQGGPGGGAGLTSSAGNRGFWADVCPDPGSNLFLVLI